MILEVDSRKRVSFGDILWNTTFWIDDLPDRRSPIRMMRGLVSAWAGRGREKVGADRGGASPGKIHMSAHYTVVGGAEHAEQAGGL